MKDFHKKLKNFIPIDSSFDNYGDNQFSFGYDNNQIDSKLELVFSHQEIGGKQFQLILDLIADGKSLFKYYSVFNSDLYTIDEAKDKMAFHFIAGIVKFGVIYQLEQRL